MSKKTFEFTEKEVGLILKALYIPQSNTLRIDRIETIISERDGWMRVGNGETEWQKCPKCDGQGIVSKPPWIAGDVYEWSSTAAQHQCNVCNGAMIILSPPKSEQK